MAVNWRRGIEGVVTIALLIIIAIALVVGVYLFTQRFFSGGNWAQVNAYQIQNKFTSTQQIAIVGVRIVSRSNSPLNITRIVARVTPAAGGAPVAITLTTVGSQLAAGTITAIADGQLTIAPGQTVELAITFVAPLSNSIGSVSFTITLADPSGNTQTFTTNEVSLT